MLPAEGGNPKPETKSQAYLRLSEFLVLEARGDPHTLLGVSCLQEKSYLCKLTLKNLLGADRLGVLFPCLVCLFLLLLLFCFLNAWILLRDFLKDFSSGIFPFSAEGMVSFPLLAPAYGPSELLCRQEVRDPRELKPKPWKKSTMGWVSGCCPGLAGRALKQSCLQERKLGSCKMRVWVTMPVLPYP